MQKILEDITASLLALPDKGNSKLGTMALEMLAAKTEWSVFGH